MDVYAPRKQASYCNNRARCVTGKAPRLEEVRRRLGDGTAQEWVAMQMYDFTEFVGCRYKLSAFQYEQMNAIVLNKYGRLKLTELMLFFYDCKSGTYGKFYGIVDPVQLMGALDNFTSIEIPKILNEWHKGKEREELRERGEISGGKHVTFEEYLLTKIKDNDFGGAFGNAARRKAEELENDINTPF